MRFSRTRALEQVPIALGDDCECLGESSIVEAFVLWVALVDDCECLGELSIVEAFVLWVALAPRT